MAAAELEELRQRLAASEERASRAEEAAGKAEEQRQKLRASLALLKERALNTGQVVRRLKECQDSLAEERRLREAAEAEMERQRRDAEAAAGAAKAAAAAAAKAAADAKAAAAAVERAKRDEAGDLRRQLEEVRAQLQRVQGDGGAAAARAPQQQEQLGGPAAHELQQQVREVAATLEHWQACFAALFSGGSPAHLAALPPPPAAAAGAGRPLSPRQQRPRQQRQRQGPTSPCSAQPAAAAAAAAAAGGAAGPAGPATQPPEEDARAKAIRQVTAQRQLAAQQAAAAPAGGGGGGHRGPNKRGRPAAAANVLAAAFESMDGAAAGGKRAKAAPAPAHGRVGGAALAPTAPAAAAEASLAISANEQPGGQPREQPAAADEAAHLLGSLTTSAPPAGPDAGQLERVAADLHLRLADGRLPLPLLLACFETAALECAAPAPQPQHLRCGGGVDGEQQGQEDGGAALAEAAPDHWFRAAGEAEAAPPRGDARGAPPFVAVWCSREALLGRHLAWLLHCAVRIHRLERQRVEASAAAAAGAAAPSSGAAARGFAAALRRHLHQLAVGCCLAAGGGDGGGGVRHTETEVCALAAAAAGLCRAFGDAEAFWALLLDLATCPAAPTVVLPALAAAADVWAAALAAAQRGSAGGDAEVWQTVANDFHSALQQLCAQAEAAADAAEEHPAASGGSAADGGDAPPPLLLERQPAAAAVFLRALGQHSWGWAAGTTGSASGAAALRAAVAEWQPGAAAAAPAPAAGPAAVGDLMDGVEVEEI